MDLELCIHSVGGLRASDPPLWALIEVGVDRGRGMVLEKSA